MAVVQVQGGSARASAAGKVILLGEHAVVYGQPALAAALDLRVRVEVRDLRGQPNAGIRVVMQGPDAPSELVHAVEELARSMGIAPQLELRLQSEIPLGSGLGSSAALGVALARALSSMAQKPCPPDEAARLALSIEKRFHGAPSGVDPAVSAREGMLLFTRGEGDSPAQIRVVAPARAIHLVVALTGIMRGTRSAVMPLKTRTQERPELYQPLMKALGELARGGALAVERGDLIDLGVRFDAAHGLLSALGVSCLELDELVQRMKRAGALGAKLTGAGGGGAAIGLAESAQQANSICLAVKSSGAQAFVVELPAGAVVGTGLRDRATASAEANIVNSVRQNARSSRRWAVAQAHANIALVKYWGKRDEKLLLPEAASLSLALDVLRTVTRVELDAPRDEMWLDGAPASAKELARARALLDAAGIHTPAYVESRNEFPTGAGLASSASGFAALAVAACAAGGKPRSLKELSALARLGSGSASRSVPGGWAVWRDESAEQVFAPSHWDLRMVIAACAAGPKEVSSRDGMRSTQQTSPFHAAFISQCAIDLPRALAAVSARDLEALGRIAESNALRMHADALAADPPILYWQPATVACLQEIAKLRARKIPVYATIDAGPHVVALCNAADAALVREALAKIPGVERAFIGAPAGAARVLEGSAAVLPDLDLP